MFEEKQEQSVLDMTGDRPFRILICSGNLGNARPDEDSIAEWLPDDGCFNAVKDATVHPLPDPAEHRAILNDLGLPHFQVHEQKIRQGLLDTISDDESKGDGIHRDYFDIIVIGMQEATFDVPPNDPMVRVPVLYPITKTVFKAVGAGVDALGSLSRTKDFTKEDSITIFGSSVNPLEWLAKEDSKVLQELFRKRLPSYNFCVRYQRGEMRLEILVRAGVEVEVLRVKAQNTGIGVNGVLNAANKGGIVAELLVEKNTRISFCSAHLQAHEGKENYLNRIRMAEAIFDGTADEVKGVVSLDLAVKSHICFMMGDLNFRSNIEGVYNKEEQNAHVHKMVVDQNWRHLNQTDELFQALRDKQCFVGFETLPCYFPPTFKLERTAGYSYKDQRRPSYTDRILWRTLIKMESCVKPVVYEPIDNFTTSDHKPIRGAFEINLNQSIVSFRPGLPLGRLSSTQYIINSARNLFHGGGDQAPAPPNTLHILVSNIKCSITKRNNLSAQLGPPDPYVSFISLPEELVRKDRSRIEKFKALICLGTSLHLQTKQKDGKTTRTASGFPRTRKMTGSYNPDWGQETIHMIVRCKDGHDNLKSANGSILMLCVMDHKSSVADNHVGSFPLNLAHMLSVRPKAVRKLGHVPVLGVGRDQRKDIHRLNLKQPLLKNTKQTGWISCSIETWWAPEDDERIASSLSTSHLEGSKLNMLGRCNDSPGVSQESRDNDLWIEEDM